jgi:hypothetical protein
MAKADSTPSPDEPQDESSSEILTNGVKLVGEAILPGASLLLDGDVPDGLIHTVLGYGAGAVFGPLGLLVVAADSYSKSVTNKHLWQYVPEATRPRRHQGQAPDATSD